MKTSNLIFYICFFAACNPARVVKPLQKGEIQAGAAIGGPLIKMGNMPVFMPLTSVQGAYGVTDKTTCFASVHTTSLLFGVLQTDAGITTNIFSKNNQSGITTSVIANAMIDHWQTLFSFLPQLDINAYKHYRQKPHYVYASLQNWFEPRRIKAHGEPQTVFWLPTVAFGHQWVQQKYRFQIEAKYIGLNQSNQNLVVKYITPGSYGALGIYFGVQKKF